MNSIVSFGCVALDVLLMGASHLVTCECLPQGDAIWPLTGVLNSLEMGVLKSLEMGVLSLSPCGPIAT
jgi:hypothetical protein